MGDLLKIYNSSKGDKSFMASGFWIGAKNLKIRKIIENFSF
jgi:hypothetical protein